MFKSPFVYTIGITGGIASGKSNVCRILEGLGAEVISADELGHRSYLPNTACYHQLVSTFGREIVAGENEPIDRKKLGAIVFSDKEKLQQLNQIVWPAIAALAAERVAAIITQQQQLQQQQLQQQQQQQQQQVERKVVAIEAAILFEAGWDKEMEENWCVYVPADVAKQRLMDRNGLSEAEAVKRIQSQMSVEDRRAKSLIEINTDREKSETEAVVRSEWTKLLARVAAASKSN